MRPKGPAKPGWPAALDALPTTTVCAYTGLLAQNLSTIRSGRMDSPSATERLSLLAAAAQQPGGSLVLERDLVSIARLGSALKRGHPDQVARWPGLLKQTLRHATYLTEPADVNLFLSEPAVREPRLRTLLAATAALAAHRIDHRPPSWILKAFLAQPWDVLAEGASPLTTPMEFASRGVLLDARHLSEPDRTGSATTTRKATSAR